MDQPGLYPVLVDALSHGLPLIFRMNCRSGWAMQWTAEHVTPRAAVDLDALVKDAQARQPHDAVKFLIRDDDYPMRFVSLARRRRRRRTPRSTCTIHEPEIS